MDSLTRLFDLFMIGAGVVLVLAIVAFVLYLRWRAAGQERGM